MSRLGGLRAFKVGSEPCLSARAQTRGWKIYAIDWDSASPDHQEIRVGFVTERGGVSVRSNSLTWIRSRTWRKPNEPSSGCSIWLRVCRLVVEQNGHHHFSTNNCPRVACLDRDLTADLCSADEHLLNMMSGPGPSRG